MVLYLSEDDVAATFDVPTCIGVLEDACRELAAGRAQNFPRNRVRLGASVLQVLSAGIGERFGHKDYTIAKRGVRFLVTLFAASGELLALIEADLLGRIRTGSASGVATRALAAPDARVLACIGTGGQARTQIEAVCAVRPIDTIHVVGRNAERLARFRAEIAGAFALEVLATTDANAAVAQADVVVTITSASEPLFDGEALRDGAHVNAAGSNRANAAEIDVRTVSRAAVIAVEDVAQARVESGDLLRAFDAGAFAWERATRLADIVAGATPGRTDPRAITLFESLGIGLWDVAAASHVYDACRAAGRGRAIDVPA